MVDTVILCSVTIILVILLGYLTKTNIGLWAIAAAYLLGAFVLKMKPSEIILLWPIKIFLMLFSVTFFYGYAVQNGSLKRLSLKLVFVSRKAPWSIPIVLFFIAVMISGMGAGDGAMVMLIPIAISIAKITQMNYFLAAASIVSGISIGGFSPISTIGIFVRELAEQVGHYGPEAVSHYGNTAMLQASVLFSVVFILSYIFFKGHRVQAPLLEKPPPFDRNQITTLALIGVFVGVLLVIPLLKALFPEVRFLAILNAKIYLTFVSFIAAILCRMFKLGDEKDAFMRVPWHALTTICGMGMLIAVVGRSGAIEMISAYLSSGGLTGGMIPIMLAVFSGIMSLFVSGFVVNTTLFPLAPGLAAGFGIFPGLLFSAIAVGAIATAVSPFSAGGGLVVACIDDEENRSKIFNRLLIWPFINILIYVILIILGV